MDEATRGRIVSALEQGSSLENAAYANRVHPSVLYDAMTEGDVALLDKATKPTEMEEFGIRIRQAMARFQNGVLSEFYHQDKDKLLDTASFYTQIKDMFKFQVAAGHWQIPPTEMDNVQSWNKYGENQELDSIELLRQREAGNE